MRRFHCDIVERGPVPGDAVPEREKKHLHKVLRASEGARVLLMNGKGTVGEAVVGRDGSLTVDDVSRFPRPSTRVHLFVAPPSSKSALDHMLRQCAEVGVWRVDFILSERSVARPSSRSAFERARLHLLEGCKQSGNPWFPELGNEILSFKDAVERAAALSAAFFGSTRNGGDAETARMIPGRVETEHPVPNNAEGNGVDVAWMVGPEGGFTDGEEEILAAAGIAPVSLGPWTLRIETAAILGCFTILTR